MNETANQLASGDTGWSPDEIKKRRVIYLVVFLVMIAGNIAGSLFGAEGAFAINLVIGIVFLALFNAVAKRVLGYSGGTLVGISLVILFIPFFSLLTIAVVDRKVYDTIKETQAPPGEIKRQLSSLAVFSLVLCLLPCVGLPMAIASVRKISKSEGRLYGKTLAWVSVVINGLLLAMMIFGITMGILSSK